MNREQKRALNKAKGIKQVKSKPTLTMRVMDSFRPLENFLEDCLKDEGVYIGEDGRPVIMLDDDGETVDATESILLMFEFCAQCALLQNKSIEEITAASTKIKDSLCSKLENDIPINKEDVYFCQRATANAKKIVAKTDKKVIGMVFSNITRVMSIAKANKTTVNSTQLREWMQPYIVSAKEMEKRVAAA